MNLIKVRYISNGSPKGRAYTFETPVDVSTGDYVQIDKDSIGLVTETGVPEKEIAAFRDKLRTVMGKYEPPAKEDADDGKN